MKRIFMFFSLMLLFAACSKDKEVKPQGVVFTSSIVELVESRAVEAKESWAGGESIMVFADGAAAGRIYNVDTDGSMSAAAEEFKHSGKGTKRYYAFYPIDPTCTTLDDYTAKHGSSIVAELSATAQGVGSVNFEFSYSLAAIYLNIESEQTITAANLTVGEAIYPLEITKYLGQLRAQTFVLPAKDLTTAKVICTTEDGETSLALDKFASWEAGKFYIYPCVMDGQIAGNGALTNPYRIYTAEDLSKVLEKNWNKNIAFRLMNDIDLEGDADNQWTPIGNHKKSFTGKFDGNGYTISGLYIDSSESMLGLFGCTDRAYISNLTVEGVVKSEGTNCAGIAGMLHNSYMVNCHNRVDVTATSRVGGVAGAAGGSLILNCSNSGAIVGDDYDDSEYSTRKQQRVGGIAGTSSNAFVVNCYNVGSVSNLAAGAVAHAVAAPGGSDYDPSIIVNCYYSEECGGVNTNGYSMELSDSYMASAAFAKDLNEYASYINYFAASEEKISARNWTFDGSYPTTNRVDAPAKEYKLPLAGIGSKDDPYQIATVEDLQFLAYVTNAGIMYLVENGFEGNGGIYTAPSQSPVAAQRSGSINTENFIFFELMADIDLEGSSDNPWSSIGRDERSYFSGIFNGAGHTISGLYLDSEDRGYFGLFGYTKNAFIANLTVKGSVSADDGVVGGIVAQAESSYIFNCHSHVDIASATCLGGIVGSASGSYIVNCSNSGSVEGDDSILHNGAALKIGGIAGSSGSTTIANCFNVGALSNKVAEVEPCAIAALGASFNEQTVLQCYYSDECGGIDPAATSTAKSVSDMQSAAFVTTLNANVTLINSMIASMNPPFEAMPWELGASGWAVTTY